MYKKNSLYILNIVKIIIIVVFNLLSFLLIKKSGYHFTIFIAMSNVCFLISFLDFIKCITDDDQEYEYKVSLSSALLIYNISLVIISFLFIFLQTVLLKRTIVIIAYSLLILIYLAIYLFIANSNDESSIKEDEINNAHDYFKLLKRELEEIKHNVNFSNELLPKLDSILDFVNYEMTAMSIEGAHVFEKRIANCLVLINEMLVDNKLEDLDVVLNELIKIFKEREKEIDELV